jgi:rubrerythrin
MKKVDINLFLEETVLQVNKNLKTSFVKNSKLQNCLETICRCNSNKAPIRFLLSCVLAKIDNPLFDIRKPYTEIKGKDSFSGRFYDEKYIEPIIHKHRLPCNSTTAFLTPAFRNLDRIIDTNLVLVGRPREIYIQTIEVIHSIFKNEVTPKSILKEVFRILLTIRAENEARMKQLLSDLKNEKDVLSLSSEEIFILIEQHLKSKGTSRLPVLLVAAAYNCINDFNKEVIQALKGHRTADKQTHAIGDIEIVLKDEKRTVTCYEMKDKKVTINDIDIAIKKLNETNHKIDNYIFISTDLISNPVKEYANNIYNQIGIEFVVLDCLGFIRHFLHFFHRNRHKFLDEYQNLMLSEPASSVSQPIKEAFLALRRAAQSD